MAWDGRGMAIAVHDAFSDAAAGVQDFCKVPFTLPFLRRRQDNVPNIPLS